MTTDEKLCMKAWVLGIAAFILANVVILLVLKYLIFDQTLRTAFFLWCWLGGCLAPIGPKWPEWKFWLVSPLLGLGRYISGILVKLFVK